MNLPPLTRAEELAKLSENLPAFRGINLLHIRDRVYSVLALIGRDGIFDEYTVHDSSHVHSMLLMLDWLVPEETRKLMSPADWLITVLSFYFHDLGMLVTREEFEKRAQSDFFRFRDAELFGGEGGLEYRAKIDELPAEGVDRFLYQEFVRRFHAERIKEWISGKASDRLGVSSEIISQIGAWLGNLDPQFKRDLALICESHHLDDLADFSKYSLSQPFGNSEDETANLQYAAILLRTADLLHITSDRAPSVAYFLISPSDPLSQEEWAKQRAVKRVRPKLGIDREGKSSDLAPKDTIEVHAYFTQPAGFFGLTSYLSYAAEQIRRNYEWVRTGNQLIGARHKFPWRYIDGSNIETEGFLPQPFNFAIDQPKILELLTGHTLYNDTRVVIRELVQNALDATRVQSLVAQKTGSEFSGEIVISWDSAVRTLQIQDNGTGMTQEIIENHLLKVGSSRYQDADFKKRFPDFFPISRFGIGLLSVFMIADQVEIFTSHSEDAFARHLSLRSVSGRYLVKTLDKERDAVARILSPHGTLVRLKVRAGADIGDIMSTARMWIVIPGVRVALRTDGGEPVSIGFNSPAEALKAGLMNDGLNVDGKRFKVEERSLDGVRLAYALRWSETFQEWEFLTRADDDTTSALYGTCIEGVRVDFDTPGFSRRDVVAIANAVGSKAPRTTVVRSGLELTPEREQLLASVYKVYCEHVTEQIDFLASNRSFSLSWAAGEASYLLSPLVNSYAINESLLGAAFEDLSVILVEDSGTRRLASAKELRAKEFLWTIESGLFRSAEHIIREVAGSGSLEGLIKGLKSSDKIDLPPDTIICGVDYSVAHAAVFSARDVDYIVVDSRQRRVDLRWARKRKEARWLKLDWEFSREERKLWPDFDNIGPLMNDRTTGVQILLQPIAVEGLDDNYDGVSVSGEIFLSSKRDLVKKINSYLYSGLGEADAKKSLLVKILYFSMTGGRFGYNRSRFDFDSMTRRLGIEGELVNLVTEMSEGGLKIYNPAALSRLDL